MSIIQIFLRHFLEKEIFNIMDTDIRQLVKEHRSHWYNKYMSATEDENFIVAETYIVAVHALDALLNDINYKERKLNEQ